MTAPRRCIAPRSTSTGRRSATIIRRSACTCRISRSRCTSRASSTKPRRCTRNRCRSCGECSASSIRRRIDAAANYGRFLHRRGELARAEEVLSKVVELDRQARGPRHAFVAHDLVNLGMVRLDTQRARAGGAGLPRGARHLCRDAAGRSSVRRVGAVRPRAAACSSRIVWPKPSRRCDERRRSQRSPFADRQSAAGRSEQLARAAC